jgi:2-methylcitrate dehydratase PrpD
VTALPEDTEVWKIRDVSLKAWAACGHIQACIDAALSVSTRIDVGSIESVAVKTYRDAIQFADCESPRNDLEYKFSLQHAAAAGLSGHTNVLDFSKRSAENIGIVKLRRKIQLQLGAPSGVDPTEAWGAEVVARTSDGGEVSCISTEPKGSTTNPMTTKEVRAKFDDLAAYGGIPHGTSAKLADDVLALTAGGDLSLFLGDLMNVSTWLSGTELHQMPPHGRAIRSVEGEASVQVHTANSAEVQ